MGGRIRGEDMGDQGLALLAHVKHPFKIYMIIIYEEQEKVKMYGQVFLEKGNEKWDNGGDSFGQDGKKDGKI